ncbi:ATP-binding protein [Streptomyces sp. NPDC012751]|uniref:ATP-binding protein n=1 Tax=unclassified Streptomyces TaxID=2593676 RepID=UPI000566A04C
MRTVRSSPEGAQPPETCPRTAERARDVARSFLSRLRPRRPDQEQAVLLVVSELVTNAIQHAGGVTGFALRAEEGRVTVTVDDASPSPPYRRRSPVWAPGGFGWPMVLELSAQVRVEPGTRGKAVRAVLPLAH